MKQASIMPLTAKSPTVSFVVPCYKLAHVLRECIDSILSQSYTDFEVLIMNDASPDHTVEVAESFFDSRVRLISNVDNLGPLRNYNKGICMSRGKYVWLISADDYLRCPYVVRQYVELMETNPTIGYAFCPGVAVRNGTETGVLSYSVYAHDNAVVPGHELLRTLLNGNLILAPSAMARRDCYDKISLFPLDVKWDGKPIDMVWGGDWYLWCMFSMSYDVAYFAEPMVCYREHELSMTNLVTRQENVARCLEAELATLWMLKQKCDTDDFKGLSRVCLCAIANEYARQCTSKQYEWLGRASASEITLDEFQESLYRNSGNEQEREWVRARCYAAIGDILWARHESTSARRFYLASIGVDRTIGKTYAKILLSLLGGPGEGMRSAYRSIRRAWVSGAHGSLAP